MAEFLQFLVSAGSFAAAHVWPPLFIWTVLLLVAAYPLQSINLNPLIRFRLATILLLALPAVFAASVLMSMLPAATTGTLQVVSLPILPEVVVTPAIELSPVPPPPVYLLLSGTLLLLAVAVSLFTFLRLLADWRALRRLAAAAVPITHPDVVELARTIAGELRLEGPVRLLSTTMPVAPASFFARRPVILLPEILLLQPAELRLTLLHELVHIKQRDYARNLIEQVIGCVFAIHPGVHWLCRRIVVLREAACDAMVLSRRGDAGPVYATLLCSEALGRGFVPQLSNSIFHGQSKLRERLVMMKKHTHTESAITRYQRLGILAGVFCLGTAVTLVACTDITTLTGSEDRSQLDVTDDGTAARQGDTYMVVEQMPEIIGGLPALMSNLTYPSEAAEAGIEGTVYVQFIVQEEGKVIDAKVVRGVEPSLDAEALRAVSELKFKPGIQSGEPVPVQFSLPVRFRLPGSESGSARDSGRAFRVSRRLTSPGDDVLVGGVFDMATETPLAGASVTVGDEFGAITDREGNYEIRGMGTGRYQMRISFAGYAPLEGEMMFAKGAFLETFDFYLQRD